MLETTLRRLRFFCRIHSRTVTAGWLPSQDVHRGYIDTESYRKLMGRVVPVTPEVTLFVEQMQPGEYPPLPE